MTWPLAAGIGHLGRTQNTGDGRFSVWNIAWVAHALSTDPLDLFDANIFYPHRRTLAFSESNSARRPRGACLGRDAQPICHA